MYTTIVLHIHSFALRIYLLYFELYFNHETYVTGVPTYLFYLGNLTICRPLIFQITCR